MNSVTGGALSSGTLFALGIGPYINASIIMQLLCVGIPALERLSKQGEDGKKKISQYTRYLTLLLAIVQAIGIIINFGSQQNAIKSEYFFDQQWLAYVFMVIVYTAGASITMWLGERITEYGVGNGISMIIFIGIVSSAGTAIINKVSSAFGATFDFDPILQVIIFCALTVIIFTLIVTVDLAERRIPVPVREAGQGP